MTIRWPDNVLAPRDVAFDIAPRTVAGPSSVSGASQVISSSAGIWTATFGGITVNTRNRVLTWRAIATLLEGRLGSILLPFCRGYQPITPGAIADGLYDGVPYSDDASFSDGSLFVGASISVQLTASISVGGTTANVSIAYGDTIQPGQVFSINDHAYRVRTAVYTSDTAATLTFRPTLRVAATTGDLLDFDDPVVKMRLASDNEMDLLLDGRRFAYPTISFVEDV